MLPLRDQLPTRRTPVITWALIAINVIAFLWEIALAGSIGFERVVFDWGLVPARLLSHPLETVPTVLTSMFMHGGWQHLLGNMLFLWIFGDNVEDAMGRGRYLFFYLVAGVAAAALQVAISPGSAIPMVGASGAIAGVLAAYGVLYPRSPILVLNPILPLWFFLGPFWQFPAWLVIAEFFVWNLLSGIGSLGAEGGGVAFFAHLGGFVAGLLLVKLLAQDKKRYDAWEGWRAPPRGPQPPRGWGDYREPRRRPW